MNLERLHTPHPLRDSDFAAIRARVHAEIERPRGWMLLFRFAFASLLVIMLVPRTRDRVPNVPSPVRTAATPVAALPPPPRKLERRLASPHSRPHKKPKPAPVLEAGMRIEIHTADPDIRIIWIVQPHKENS